MFNFLANNQNPDSVASKMRRKRTDFLRKLIETLPSPIHILDVGGTESYWRTVGFDNSKAVITLLNLQEIQVSSPYFKSIKGNALSLEFENNSFDIVFSNSVIEHVGNFEMQKQMANEIQRVGKRYFVQTPNKYFPIEPHFVFPLFQFFPFKLKSWLLMNFKLGWFQKISNQTDARLIIESIKLLDKKEFTQLFPGSLLYEEKIFGMTKSLIVYRGFDQSG